MMSKYQFEIGNGLSSLLSSNNRSSLYLILGLVSASTLYYLNESQRRRRRQRTKNKTKKTLPYAPGVGTLETIREFGGKDCPLFILKLARSIATSTATTITQNGGGGMCCSFRLSLPIPGGIYIINDINLAKKILKDPTTDKSPLVKRVLNQILGSQESIVTSRNNAHWKMMRKLTSPAFAVSEIKRMKDIALRLTEELCHNKFTTTVTNTTPEAFLQPHDIIKITFQIICEAAFEYNVTDNEFHMFSSCVDKIFRELLVRQVANPLRGTILGQMFQEVREAREAGLWIRLFAQRILDEYRANPNKSTQATLINLIASCDEIESDTQRVAEMLVYIVAGHDTTACTISNLLVLLAKNPDIAEKLRTDTMNLLPEEWSQKSEYFNFCVKETHRFVPVVALGPARTVGIDYFVDDDDDYDYIIPKGAIVLLPQVTTGRDNKIFDNADTFNPDRWYTATPEMNESIIPFAIGNRNCIGQSLAYAEIDTILPTILSKFNLILVQEGELQNFVTWKFTNFKLLLKNRE